MPEEKFQLLSEEEAKKLLKYLNQKTCLKLNDKVNLEILEIMLKVYRVNNNSVDIRFPKGVEFSKGCFSISLTQEAKQQLELLI
ncbi:hypothetical protein KKH38_03635 [Patescibacteria group bacterium]|nr:hypothetical protein [Patescibacteria group bacterium]MBU4601355.1 hypothetical protein [Patescibacteria group bacterium]MCG2698804.1 hypothetical protein [Candidatus Parcubacteria bacterium]